MADPFLGQISCFGFNFAPYGWMLCAGQTLPISQYSALFALLGTNYGGNGTSTFQLPNLQGNVPVSWGQGPGLSNYVIGETAGVDAVTLTLASTPPHVHSFTVQDSNPANLPPVAGQAPAKTLLLEAYAPTSAGTAVQLAPAALSLSPSGNQPHNNVQPSLALNWCIAISGVFPSRG